MQTDGIGATGPHGIDRKSIQAACTRTAVAMVLLAIPGGALAQDNDGEFWVQRKNQITVTATRAPMLIADAPVTVTVKTAEDIADELVTDIKDLVRFEPGVSVARAPTRFGAALGTTGRAGNEGFNIRGIGGNRVLIQVDGVRVPDGFSFGAQGVGRGDYVDLGLVKSVEILRGPASALYGSDGLAGAVSFITSDPEDFLKGRNIGGLARAAYSSSDNEFAETLILSAGSGNVSGMIAYTRRDFNELDNKGTNDVTGAARTTPNPQDGRSDAALARLVWKPGGAHKIRLTGEYLDTRLDANILSGLSASVLDLRAHDTGSRGRVGIDWSWSGEGTIEFARIGAYWQASKDRQFTFEDRNPAANRTRINTFDNRIVGASAEARLGWHAGASRFRLTVGGDISQTQQKGLRDGTIPPFGETFPARAFPVTDYLLAGVFAGGELSFVNDAITLYPAVRFDTYDLSPKVDPLLPNFIPVGQSDSRLSPKLGAVIKLNDMVRFYGGYAQGFKAPEPSQVNQFFENLAFGYTSAPNPDLGPEKSESYEIGMRLVSDAVSLNIAAFKADFDDFISQEVVGGRFTPTDPAIFQFINLTKVKVKGAEAKLELSDASGLHGQVALSYAKGRSIDGVGARTPLSSIDPLKLVAGIGYRAPDNRFGGQIIATHSARKSIDQTVGVCRAECFRPAAFTILDATAFVRFGDLTVRGGIFNIFDEKYAWWSDIRGLGISALTNPSAGAGHPDAYTQPGRNASVSVSYRF